MTANKHKTRSRWKRWRRRFRDRALRLLLPTIAWLPFGFTRRVFPWLAGLIAPFIRKQALANLDLAYGESLGEEEKKRIAAKVAKNLALVAAEILALWHDKLPDDYLSGDEAAAMLTSCMDESGKGCVGITGHLGNWELLGYWAKKVIPDYVGAAIARRPQSVLLQLVAERARQKYGLELIWQDESMRRSLRLLDAGKMVATVPDQDVRSIKGIFVPFFGRNAHTPTGPAALARLSGSPIAIVIAKRKAYGMEIRPVEVITPDPALPRDEDIARMTKLWSESLEREIRKQPADWMWFHRRWRSTPASLAARRERKRAKS